MSSVATFAGCQLRRDFGLEKMKRHEYQEAIKDFQMVVENLLADNDQKAALKMFCFNQMALCYIELNEFDKAKMASAEAICIFDIMRPNELEKKYHRKNDVLFPHFHTSFVRRGQVFEKQKDFKAALEEYRKANALTTKGEANQRIQEVLVQFGIPAIDLDDENLKPFSQIANNLFDPQELISNFRDSITLLGKNPPTQETIKYLDMHGITQLILGILNFNISSEILVDISLTVTNFFIRNGATGMWANTDVIKKVIVEYQDNTTIISDILTTLASCPNDKFIQFAEPEILKILLDAFNLELKDEELDGIFLFFFHVISSDRSGNSTKFFEESTILDLIAKKKTQNALILLSRLSFSKKIIDEIKVNGMIDMVFEFLKEHSSLNLHINASTIILEQILNYPESSDKFNIEEYATRCFEELTKIVMLNTKNFDNLNELLKVLSRCIKYAPKAVGPSKIITATSAVLSVNNTNAKLILTSLGFLYECAHQGLIEELNNSNLALKAAMSTLQKFPKNQTIVENAVGIACLMEHPKREELLQAALLQFPKTEFLKPFVYLLTQYAIPKQ
ncbi:hypothetical protein TRFO_18198 [Tritrichomonas foetus]|uniref:TPR Domain containing protein n=1 Tax=Tritrichomonas foetus TaxID=1144522 RepID=A0A1J4KLK9_9EUKA|nr:hypothetical protein TRFO_18198 [Tritrichomonas foetus]|eukprot:OHT12185.1 hypothetical protein TRFO_18198 [Tritrichomonas foetus]